MKKKGYLLLFGVVIIAFWQVAFLQNGMKWDFVDAFLPSRYFFSESILNNQFPLWNPYLLYGTPIYADMASVFNPEFWIVANMFGYSNISLQFMFLIYVFVAGVAFNYFLKQFNTQQNLALSLSVAYMLSGFSIGNAQHLSFVMGYAIIPFVLAAYIQLHRQITRPNLIRFALAIIVMIYASYPGLTIILGYFLLCILIYYSIVNRSDKSWLRSFLISHALLFVIVIMACSVLLLSYFQATPFLSRYGGLNVNQALLNPFTFQSLLSFLLPMSTGNASQFFATDTSMSNGYWGIISVVLFLFCLTQRKKSKESYLFLLFGVFALLVSMGNQFFLREFLFNYAPLMNYFKYPSIFRAFSIFGFLTFIGLNFNGNNLSIFDRKKLIAVSFSIIFILIIIALWAYKGIESFGFFEVDKRFPEEVLNSTLYDNILFQGSIQVCILLSLILLLWKVKNRKHLSVAILLLFVTDGIISTQLNTYYTVISKTNPIAFFNYLKSSPKGFPIPELNSIGENSDKNAGNEFTWRNNNIFPKKVTYDGLVSFKLDGYEHLANHHPKLLKAIKKQALVYLSDDIARNSNIENFKPNTISLSYPDYNKVEKKQLESNANDQLQISGFSPTEIKINLNISQSQLLCYQQNYYTGWNVFVDGIEQDLLQSNFAHMAVFVPSGEHKVVFKYSNSLIKYTFYFVAILFISLLALLLYYFIIQHPENKKRILIALFLCLAIFLLFTSVNRHLYKQNKQGATKIISEKMVDWKDEYGNKLSIFLSTHQANTKNAYLADTICFVDEKTNKAELSGFLMNNNSEYFAFAWQGCIISNDIYELITSFYPQIIEQNQNTNSGILLLGKVNASPENLFSQNFEASTKSLWSIDETRIVSDPASGNRAYSFKANEIWGTTLELTVGEDLPITSKISIIADFKFNQNMVSTPLVFSVDRKNETIFYETVRINKFAKHPDNWYRVAFIPKLNKDLKKGDIIKVYFWNKEKGQFLVDNLKLRISSSE